MTLLGIIMMLLGLMAIFSPLVVGVSVIMLIGILVVIAGFARMIWALKAESLGKGIFTMLIGGLTLVCGIAMLANPVFGSGVLTIILAAYFVVDGVMEIVVALRARPVSGWGVVLFSGIISLILGILIWRQFPLSGAWAIGVLIGIKLFIAGFIMITVGSTARALGKEAAGD